MSTGWRGRIRGYLELAGLGWRAWLLVLAAFVVGFVGLLVAGPVLGHASWHAYRASVRPVAPAALDG